MENLDHNSRGSNEDVDLSREQSGDKESQGIRGIPGQQGYPGPRGPCGQKGEQSKNGHDGLKGKDLIRLTQYINEIGTHDISPKANMVIMNFQPSDIEKAILWLPKLQFLEPDENGLFTPLCVEIYITEKIEYVINAAIGDTINKDQFIVFDCDIKLIQCGTNWLIYQLS